MLWTALYGTVNISYGSMASVISGDSAQRSSLPVFFAINLLRLFEFAYLTI